MNFPAAFTAAQTAVLEDLHARDCAERQAGIREDMSLKAVAPSVARLLYMLVTLQRAKQIVEFGTSHGYSTIHLAAAAERTGGRVHTVDAISEKTRLAARNLEAAGLLDRTTLVTADAAAFAASLPNQIDFVLVDIPIPPFIPAFEPLRERLAPGCVVFVDGGPDGYWDSEGVRPFTKFLEHSPDFIVTRIPMEKEQLLAIKIGGSD